MASDESKAGGGAASEPVAAPYVGGNAGRAKWAGACRPTSLYLQFASRDRTRARAATGCAWRRPAPCAVGGKLCAVWVWWRVGEGRGVGAIDALLRACTVASLSDAVACFALCKCAVSHSPPTALVPLRCSIVCATRCSWFAGTIGRDQVREQCSLSRVPAAVLPGRACRLTRHPATPALCAPTDSPRRC